MDKNADPGPGAPLGGGDGSAEGAAPAGAATGGLKEPERLGVGSAGAAGGSSGPGDVSPPVSTVDAGDAPKSGAVSAISKEDAPKASTEAVADGVVGDSGKTAQSIRMCNVLNGEGVETDYHAAVEPATQAPAAGAGTTTTETTDPAPATSKENVPPQVNGTSSANASTDTPTAPPTTTDSTPAAAAPATADSTNPSTTTETTKTAPSDEKMPTTMEEPPPIKTVRAAPGMSATSGPLEDFPEGGDAKD